ncbi:hypothetical protein ISF_06448 [Cordyceps fumosorosea ARSEF 2679]|uniref:Uncharacterized protein n=1 Tax=Cordyceps fumosorosea (strain ARSEF 2679) TaxID=1081104 RepID=A0A167RJU7_CORFA|nr:hypothetical protein ISF_06448 [Cordyceps fumosorosea ARSEF 2679]OAA58665.1 hypothetical protein ISF_06448 [Cordyceps fumosorosea ARSEF 2679]
MAANVPNTFGLSCATYSLFYADKDLNSSAFLGCCEINPKSTPDWLCPEKNIRQMTYNPKAYPKIPVQMCLDPTAQWWSCAYIKVPFLGCCVEDPCRVGSCSKFKGARLAENKDTAKSFLDRATSIVPDPSAATVSATTIPATRIGAPTNLAPDATTTAAPSPSGPGGIGGGNGDGGSGIQPGVAAGIAVGAAAGAVGVALLILWLVRRKRSAAANQPADTGAPAVSEAPFSPDSQATAASPKRGMWRSSVWSRNSAVVPSSKYVQTPPTPSAPFPPAYQAVATQDASGPVELPTNVCFELPTEGSTRPMPGR